MTVPPSIPTQVTFRGLGRSARVEAEIHERVAWLHQFYGDILRCRVVVELPHRHRRDGRPVHARIELSVPQGHLVVSNHEPSTHGPAKHAGLDAHRKDTATVGAQRYARAAVHQAFDLIRRRLEDFAREQRRDVKTHAAAGA